jgi:hypothetical protein
MGCCLLGWVWGGEGIWGRGYCKLKIAKLKIANWGVGGLFVLGEFMGAVRCDGGMDGLDLSFHGRAHWVE